MYINYLLCLNENYLKKSNRRVNSCLDEYKLTKSINMKSCDTRVKVKIDLKKENIPIRLPLIVTNRKQRYSHERAHSNIFLSSRTPFKCKKTKENSLVFKENYLNLQTKVHHSTTDQELQVDL